MRRIFLLYLLLLVLTATRIVFFYAWPMPLKVGQQVQFETTLLAEPKIVRNSQQMQVRIGDFWHSSQVQIKAPADQQFSFGNVLQVSGRISQNGKGFWIITSPKIEVKKPGLLSFLGLIRGHIIAFSEQSLPPPYSSLALGILLGVKNNLSFQIATAMRQTGFSHFLVIDGMKVTLFASYTITLLGAIFKRRWATIISIIFIGVYITLSGLEVSALRAGIMAILAFSATLWGRQYTSLHSLVLVSEALLLSDPSLLVNVGFQLSVAATAGIIILKPLIPLHGILLDDISITLAAQIATLPILLSSFGSYGLLSIPAHTLVLWEVPLIMIICVLGVLISFIALPLGSFLLQLSLPLLWYFKEVTLFFGKFNWNLEVAHFSLISGLGYYTILVGFLIWRNYQITTKSK